MVAVRLAKILPVVAIALTCTLVVFGNIVDPAINFSMVQHVLSMDTVPSEAGITDRSITDPTLQRAAFVLIVAGEALTALLLRHLPAPPDRFARAKLWAITGLSLGFLIWQAGFLGIGAEWFGMWMSKTWNGQESAFRFAMTVLGVLIYVSLPEQEA